MCERVMNMLASNLDIDVRVVNINPSDPGRHITSNISITYHIQLTGIFGLVSFFFWLSEAAKICQARYNQLAFASDISGYNFFLHVNYSVAKEHTCFDHFSKQFKATGFQR